MFTTALKASPATTIKTGRSYPSLRPVVYEGSRKGDLIDSLTEIVITHGPFATGVHESEYLLFNVRPLIAHMKGPCSMGNAIGV